MQDLIKHLPAVIYEYTIHPDGTRRFDFISEACDTFLGIPASAVMNDVTLMDSIVHPEDLDNLRASSLACEQAGREWNWQGRMHVRGLVKWVEIRSNYELRNDGVIVRRGIIQDITERKETARESEARYQSLVERLPIGVVIHKQGRLVFANAFAHSILGGEKSENLVGTDLLTFVHPDYQQRVIRRMKEVAEGMPGAMIEQKYIRQDGQTIDVETMAYPFNFRGEQCVQVIFRDITERKQTEARIKKNETLLAQLFQNVPMAVVLLTDSGKVEQVNRGFEEMFGYSLSELRGRSINDFIVPEELTHEGVDLNNLITSHRIVSIETVRRHRHGRIVNVILYGMPVLLDNETIGIYGVYVDITERKRVEEELKIRNGELDNFVYKVSHDLRAPLSSILGLVNLAKLPGNTDNPMDYIDIIGTKVEHLDHFIGDVLSHSKNLKMEVSVMKVDFSKIINETFADLNYLEGAKEIRQIIKVDGIDFYSDPWRIAEILRNLISNAIKYRQLDEVTPEIGIKINIDHLRAEIIFADNGIGISEENLERIFEMFYRATEQSDGSGIGLYIVKNAIDKLGGQITVASRVGQGTRFAILLPNRINSMIGKMPSVGVEQ
ncbi:PAS domain-containing sensor histidine kinase [Chryseolinea lacunae]|uniref:histidine kinase n=1 Tax=Chryseolinea lacunae TaxID=2801331 RepID=A0ABS1KRT9_9BACT|nr:PAS domain-containing sensor histidine kinase [Chryseolinea lacunae]MBL0742171.1 PAS domain S-box protein [Chryseolinea lacunae]